MTPALHTAKALRGDAPVSKTGQRGSSPRGGATSLCVARVSGERFDADWIEVPSEEDDWAPAGFTADGFARILARPSLEKRIESDLAFTRELQDKAKAA